MICCKTSRTTVCGGCFTNELVSSRIDQLLVAFCGVCGLAFKQSTDNAVVDQPSFFKPLVFLEKHNQQSSQAKQLRLLDKLPDWLEITPDMLARKQVRFEVSMKRVTVNFGLRGSHIVKQELRSGIHLRLMHNSHAKAEQRVRQELDRRYDAWKAQREKIGNPMQRPDDYVESITAKRRQQVKQANVAESAATSRAWAECQVPRWFGREVHKLDQRGTALREYCQTNIQGLAASVDVMMLCVSFVLARLVQYQASLPDNHVLRKCRLSDNFDFAPYKNRSGLRMSFGKFGSRKPVWCKCVGQRAKTIEKQRSSTSSTSSPGSKAKKKYVSRGDPDCAVCEGSGRTEDERPAQQCCFVMVDKAHPEASSLQDKIDHLMDVLLEKANLPMYMSLVSTTFNPVGFDGQRDTPSGMYVDATPRIGALMSLIPLLEDLPAQPRRRYPAAAQRVIDQLPVVEAVQKLIRETTDVYPWSDVVVRSIKERPNLTGGDAWFDVELDHTSGVNFCLGKNTCGGMHRSNRIFFILEPSSAQQANATMYQVCWSSGCKHSAKTKTALRARQEGVWRISPEVAAIIWEKDLEVPKLSLSVLEQCMQPSESSQSSQSKQTKQARTSQHSRLGEPDQPDQPYQPDQFDDQFEPAEPAERAERAEPAEPAERAEPAEPAESAEPAEPGQSGHLGQFAKPSLREQLRKTLSARLLLHAALSIGDVNECGVLRSACVGAGMVQVAAPQPRRKRKKKR